MKSATTSSPTVGALALSVVFLLGFTYLFDRWVTRRVSKASKLARAVSRGQLAAETDGGPETARDDIGSLVRALHRMRDDLRAKANLEAEARAEREKHAQAMADIADNVPAGFFIVDAEYRVRPGFTASCRDLLGKEIQAGEHLCDLFDVQNEAARMTMEMAIEGFFEAIMPFELLSAQMPRRFERPDGRVLALEARPVEHGDEVYGVLLSVQDITALEAAEAQTRKANLLIQLIAQREAFRAFLDEVCDDLRTTRLAARRGDQAQVRRSLHTIKGNAGCYGLTDVVMGIHAIEEAPELGLAEIDATEQLFVDFMAEHGRLLRLNYGEEEKTVGLELDAGDVAELEALTLALPSVPAKILSDWLVYKKTRSARQMLGPVERQVERLAARFDKAVTCEVHGGEVRVDPKQARTLFRIVPHLLRNAIDHGIEPADERGDKPSTARVDVQVTASERWLRLSVSDDGRGIDPEVVARRAVDLGLMSAEDVAAMSDQQKMELIYADELSTKLEASEVSGRGVGMAAVRGTALALGDTVHLDAKLGLGTTVTLEIPIEAATQAAPSLLEAA